MKRGVVVGKGVAPLARQDASPQRERLIALRREGRCEGTTPSAIAPSASKLGDTPPALVEQTGSDGGAPLTDLP